MPNDLDAVIPQILAQALDATSEEMKIIPTIHTDWSTETAKRGSQIEIPGPAVATVQAVAPAIADQAVSDSVERSSVVMTLDEWYESSFALSEKEVAEVMDGVINAQVKASGQAMAKKMTQTVYNLYQQVPYSVGINGTTPFASSATDAIAVRKMLNTNKVPPDDRYCVLDADAEAAALELAAFQHADKSGTTETQREGVIGRKFGINWLYDQLAPSHTKGAATSGAIAIDNASNEAVGETEIHVDGLTTKPNPGDLFTIAGDTTVYTVISATALVGTDSDLTIYPPLVVAADDGDALTFEADHAVNIAYHKAAFALAVRQLPPPPPGLGVQSMTMQDARTGVALRLLVKYQNYQTRWSIDALWGVKCLRPEFAVRLKG